MTEKIPMIEGECKEKGHSYNFCNNCRMGKYCYRCYVSALESKLDMLAEKRNGEMAKMVEDYSQLAANAVKITQKIEAQLTQSQRARKELVEILTKYTAAVDAKQIITRIFHCYKNGKEALLREKEKNI